MRPKDSNNSSGGTFKPLPTQMSFPEFDEPAFVGTSFYSGPDDEEDNKKDEDETEKEKEDDYRKEDSYALV